MQAGGLATEQMMAWLDRVRAERGLLGEQVTHLGDLLRQEGLQEIEAQTIQLKVGAWGGRAGVMMERDILTGVQALKEPCCAMGVDAEEFEACVQAMAAEWQRAQVCCVVYAVYGRRVI